jgi:hypothetical protein
MLPSGTTSVLLPDPITRNEKVTICGSGRKKLLIITWVLLDFPFLLFHNI